MLYAIAASATLILVMAVPRSAAKARRRLARLWRAREAWAEQMDRESQSRPQSPLVGSWRGPRKEDETPPLSCAPRGPPRPSWWPRLSLNSMADAEPDMPDDIAP